MRVANPPNLVSPAVATATAVLAAACTRAAAGTTVLDPTGSRMPLLSLFALGAGATIKIAEGMALNAIWRPGGPKNAEDLLHGLPSVLVHSPEQRLEPILRFLEDCVESGRLREQDAKKQEYRGRWDRVTTIMTPPVIATASYLASPASPAECFIAGWMAGVVTALPSSNAKADHVLHHVLRAFLPTLVAGAVLFQGSLAAPWALTLGLIAGITLAMFPPKDSRSKAGREADRYGIAQRDLERELNDFVLGTGGYESFGRYDAPVFEPNAPGTAQTYKKWFDDKAQVEGDRLGVLEKRFAEIRAALGDSSRRIPEDSG